MGGRENEHSVSVPARVITKIERNIITWSRVPKFSEP